MADAYQTPSLPDGASRKTVNAYSDGDYGSPGTSQAYEDQSYAASQSGQGAAFHHQIPTLDGGFSDNMTYGGHQSSQAAMLNSGAVMYPDSAFSMAALKTALPSFQSDGSARQMRTSGSGLPALYTQPYTQQYGGAQHATTTYNVPAQGQYYAGYTQSGRPMYQQQTANYGMAGGQQEAYSPTQYAYMGSPVGSHAGPYSSLNYQVSPGIGGYPVGYASIQPGHQRYPQSSAYGVSQTNESDNSPVPRGPPRKPKQSGFALWVGNLPPGANITDLKDHFSRNATRDIESLFLISKSNCAFVNYRTEDACIAAMQRFHDSRFQGIRLVCRLRRGSNASLPSAIATRDVSTLKKEAVKIETSPSVKRELPANSLTDGVDGVDRVDGVDGIDKNDSHVDGIEESDGIAGSAEVDGVDETGTSTQNVGSGTTRAPEKYFVIKSLTLHDLEQSIRTGIWATQAHNEKALNDAFRSADSVLLIFSANKSGEYFGYARMTSAIGDDATTVYRSVLPTQSQNTTPANSNAPRTIPTPATETAPKGAIIDDSARGTIFWEADLSDEGLPRSGEDGVAEKSTVSDDQAFGKPFRVEWMSTNRLPFYRTRGLRNSWNADREVKIARDGTELEPGVGKRLVSLFHRPVGMPAVQ